MKNEEISETGEGYVMTCNEKSVNMDADDSNYQRLSVDKFH